MTWADYGVVAMMGLFGGAHCVGMCAPFALAVSAGGAGGFSPLLARHLAYQLGKATAYVFLGVLLSLATGWVDLTPSIGRAQDWLAAVAGVTMLGIGLGYALGWRWFAFGATGAGLPGRACAALRVLWSEPSLWRCVLTGWINGFLPCGLSFAALLFLASRDSLPGLVSGAYVFGLATLPALLVFGWLGGRVSARVRGRGLRIAGLVLAGFGVVTIFRGAEGVHHWFHAHTLPADATGGAHSGHEPGS